jgi:ABC-type nitrate/sulfonate/bicarbonate transport system substrate-binding protein
MNIYPLSIRLLKINLYTLRNLFFTFLVLFFFTLSNTARVSADPIRLGWQVPWATQGQLVMGLKYTNIPKLTGIDVTYTGFTYGGPLNRAALAGKVDVLLTADQPALVLVSKGNRFAIVGRMMYNRVCLYVPPKSVIQNLKDLEGKHLSGPVGAAAERVALVALREAGVDIKKIRAGSFDMAQQSAVLKTAKSKDSWPGIDALYGFDPLPAIFESNGQARMIHCGKVVSVVVASRDMIEKRPAELESFLRAFKLSWYHFSQKPKQVNRWFSAESRLNVGDDVLDKCASIEPNRWVKSMSDLRLTFVAADYKVIDTAMDFLLDRGIVKTKFDYRKSMDFKPLETALAGQDLMALYRKVRATGAAPK